MNKTKTAAGSAAVQNTPLLDKINALSDWLRRMNEKAESIRGKLPETVIFLIWTALHFVISAFHERWFDEAIAWLIAKNTSLSELIFVTPHYEGHPQLWHLLLMPFAKSGAPYSLSLTIISYVFMGSAVFLLLFRTSLPRIMRWMLPFSYFILFEYGVISRPYCVLTLSMVLIGILHPSRNTRPLPYILSMLLLCMSMAYGIVIAGSICAVWSFEIILEKKKAGTLPSLLKDKRVLLLGLLLIFAIVQILFITPREDTYATRTGSAETALPVRFLYTLFVLPLDSLITNIFFFDNRLDLMRFEIPSFCIGILIGLLLVLLLIRFGQRKNTHWYFIAPHCIFSCFTSIVYFSQHHIGIYFAFLLFWLIITIPAEERTNSKADKPSISVDAKKLIHSAGVIFTALVLVIAGYQGLTACVKETWTNFALGKREADFIREHNLERCHIMSQWLIVYEKDPNADKDQEPTSEMLIQKHIPSEIHPELLYYYDTVAAYAGHNIFYHFNNGAEDHAYFNHRLFKDEESEALLEEIAQMPIPDVILGSNNSYEITNDYLYATWGEDAFENEEYVRVYVDKANRLWKSGSSRTEYLSIYVREKIAEELGLERIPDSDIPI